MADGTGRVFGIDLGTTYSAIAYIDETGRPTVCRNDNNAETTPSVVQFETPTNVVVGEAAKQSAFIDADSVVSLIKRQMGEDREYEFHGVVHTPESISALILRRLATDATNYTSGPVEQVVISVPAYFGARQKEATYQAGLIAGLDVVGILPEPVAAAVHYDLTKGGADKTVLVYDLGGGTFDTTVIHVGASEITVVCTDGDTNLGGADWDGRLRDHLLDRFVAQAAPPESPEDDAEFLQEVANKAEEVKKQLSVQESRPVQLRFAGAAARIEVTRAEFETMTKDLLDRTIEIVRRTLQIMQERSPGATIDEVLLVGGSTRMPMVSDRLAEEFGWDPKLHEPELAVAKGAAIFALSRLVYKMQQEASTAPVVTLTRSVPWPTSSPRSPASTACPKRRSGSFRRRRPTAFCPRHSGWACTIATAGGITSSIWPSPTIRCPPATARWPPRPSTTTRPRCSSSSTSRPAR